MNRSSATSANEGGNEAAARLQSELIEPWADATRRCTRAAFDWSAEALRFAGHRLERTREAIGHLPECRSWDEVMKLQMDWTKDLMDDYLDESRQFLEIAQKTAGDASAAGTARRGNGNRRAG